MPTGLETIYRFLLRLQGAYVLAFCGIFVLGVPAAISRDYFVLPPAIGVFFGAVVATAYVMPRFTPRFLSHPRGLIGLLIVAPFHAIVPLLFILIHMSAVIVHGVPEPLSKNLSLLACLGSVGLSGLMFWLAVALGLWPADDGDAPPDFLAPPPPPGPPPGSRIDARAIRLSRTGG